MKTQIIATNIFAIIRSDKLKRFLIIGTTAALLNLLLIYIMISILKFDSYVLRNISNILAMVVSMTFAFILNRCWTWRHIPYKTGGDLFTQYILYNSLTLIGLGFRALLFALLEYLGIFYLLNVSLGIGFAAIINFIMYDKHVFRKEQLSE